MGGWRMGWQNVGQSWWGQATCCAPLVSCRSSKPLPLLGCGCPALQHRSSLQTVSTAAMEQGSCTACYLGRRERSSWSTLFLCSTGEKTLCAEFTVYHCSSLREVLTVLHCFCQIVDASRWTSCHCSGTGSSGSGGGVKPHIIFCVSIISIMHFLKKCLFPLQLTGN